MKTQVITLSKTFPIGHPNAGLKTGFKEGVLNARDSRCPGKYHTLRGNYDRWRDIFDKIDRGEMCLSIREWSGIPYRSPQVEICRLTKEDGIGLQKLEFYNGCLQQPIIDDGMTISVESLAQNDGLSFDDWKNWFKGADLSKPMAIIQFTKFRY